MCCITIAHQCGPFFQKTRLIGTNGLTGSDVRLCTAVLLCVPLCLRLCIYVSVWLCLHLFSAAPPSSSHWQFACLHFSHSDRGITPLTTSVSVAWRDTPQRRMEAAQINTQVHVDAEEEAGGGGGFREFVAAPWIAQTWAVSLADTHLALGIIH